MAYDNNSYEQGSNITREVVDQNTKPLRKAGGKAGKKAGKVAAKAGAKAAKAGGKAAAEGAKGLGTAIAANPVVAIAVLVIVILLLIILLIFQQGSASSSYKQVFRDNAIGESRYYNYPSTKEEAVSSIKDDQIARDDTESIVKILHEVKREDYQNISKIAKSAVKKAALKTNLFTLDDVDVEQSLQSAKKEASEMSGWCYGYIGASGNGSSGTSLNPDDFYGTPKYAGCGGGGIYISKYKNRGWTALYRPKDPATALAIANAAKEANKYKKVPPVKYSADKKKRQTLYKEAEKVNFDFSQIKTKCYSSCSSFASVCARAGGIPKEYAKALTWSDKLPGDLMKSGLYEKYTGKKYANDPNFWRPGDMLVLNGEHCYTVVQSKNKIDLSTASGSSTSPGSASSGSSSGGEDIAAMAEKLAWPKGTSKNKYQKGKGGAPTKAFKDAWDKYYGGNISAAACCCHSARTVLAVTAGKKVKKTLLPQGKSAEKAKKNLEKAVNGLGYNVITWNGNISSLKRGDICTYRKTGGKEGHVFIYLGNGLAAHGGKTNGYYLRISGMNSSAKTTTGKCWYYIIRKTEGTASSDTGATYQKQPSGTILKEITADTGRRVKIKNGSKYDVAQSIAASDDGFAVALVAKSANGPGEIRLYDSTGIYKSKYSATIYHANGATMTADNELLVTGALHSSNGRKFTYSGDSLSDGGTYKFPRTTSGIAYDKETGVYALSEGKALITTTDMNNTKKVLSRSEHGPWYGDIAAGGGYIFACHSINKKGNNYVDIYSEETGDFCGSYKVSYGELESACLFNGELVLLVHGYGTETNYLHFTGIQVTGGSSMAEPITVLDMDILAAYNISISNSATIKEDEPEGEKGTIFKSGSSDGWSDKDGYKDISNKNVELYWFGLNRGLINYEKDFKKKIDRIFKGNAVVKVDNSKKTIEKPDASDWKLLLANKDNAIPDDYDANLVEIGSGYTAGHESCRYIRSEVKGSLTKMMDACKKAGGSPVIISSYRSKETQKKLYDAAVAEGRTDTQVPGHSEHETGMAVDIIEKGTESNWDDADAQAATATQKWLLEHCAEYGFILRYPKGKESVTGIDYESWHYRYVGSDHAKTIMDLNCTLEEYLSGEVQPSEEDEKDTSKHFYKVVVGNSAETVTTIDEDGNKVKKKIVPMTIKEKEVDELMNPLFGVNPDEDYINSKTIKTAKQEEHEKNGTALKDGETSRLLKIDGGTATNLKAAYSISDITGIMLYGRPEQIDPNIAAFPNSSSYGTGALKLPLPPGSFTITDTFQSLDPIRGGRRHDGLDLGAPTGTPIYASLPGEVTLAKYNGGYGNCVVIQSGTTKITYGHMSKILVEAGHTVQAGQVIGQVGNTGHSFGSHLHFEVSINGKLVDPKPLLGL